MTGYQSKRAMAQDKLAQPEQELIVGTKTWFEDGKVITQHLTAKEVYKEPAQEPWRESASDYERGFIDGMQKQAQSSVDKAVNRMAQRTEERNFCPRCGKRTADLTTIHTCTPPQKENT